MSVFKTTVHQTLDNKENADHVELHGPFPAENISGTFLGGGYYFWDNHLDLAHWWGGVHCAGNYFICEGNLEISHDLFFDLVGNRQHQILFQKLIDGLGVKNIPIGAAIEMLKDMEAQPSYRGIFPYKVIRAVDVAKSSFPQQMLAFVSNKSGWTTLSPRLIICMLERNRVYLQTFKVIFPEEYAQ